jgi:hypothetical protein
VGKDVAPLVHSICAMLKGEIGEVTATSERLARPRLETVNGSVCVWPPKPRLQAENSATGEVIVRRGGVAATTAVSLTVMVSFTGTDTVVEGGEGGIVPVPVPLSMTDCVKFGPVAVLVRLLRAALSVNVMVPVGAPEGGATYEIEKMQAPAGGRLVGKEVAPLVHST